MVVGFEFRVLKTLNKYPQKLIIYTLKLFIIVKLAWLTPNSAHIPKVLIMFPLYKFVIDMLNLVIYHSQASLDHPPQSLVTQQNIKVWLDTFN